MILCTRCGFENAEDVRFCINCGRKLQSIPRFSGARRTWAWARELGFDDEVALGRDISPTGRQELHRLGEALGYSLAILGGLYWGLAEGEFWVLQALMPVLGGVALMRRL